MKKTSKEKRPRPRRVFGKVEVNLAGCFDGCNRGTMWMDKQGVSFRLYRRRRTYRLDLQRVAIAIMASSKLT